VSGGSPCPWGLENLYFIGMAAPRGAHLAARQEPDDRFDIVRPIWDRTHKGIARLRRRRKPAAARAIDAALTDG
jgi:hypothetical protein